MNEEAYPMPNPRPTSSEEWIGEVLDGSTLDPTGVPLADMDRSRLADVLFLDSLLQEVHHSDSQTVEQRVQRVMAAIDQEAGKPQESEEVASVSKTSRRRWLVSSLSMAAGVAGVGTAWFFSGANTATAQEALELALLEFKVPVDRHYQITTTLAGPSENKIVSDLYVQGGEKFALHQPTPLGTHLWIGSNGTKVWFVPAIGPVFVSNDPAEVRQWIEDRQLPVPFLQVTAILSLMARDYELTLQKPESLNDHPGIRWQRLRGTRETARFLLPKSIDVWVHPKNGVVGRLELNWFVPQRAFGLKQIRFDLASQALQPADWYDASAHFEEGRPVLEL
ncbi:MAG: hypothetical protein U1D30_14620 [Planctomycetota bacterium]